MSLPNPDKPSATPELDYKKYEKKLEGAFSTFYFIAGLGFFIWGSCILIGQIYGYLQKGLWEPRSLLDLLAGVIGKDIYRSWLFSPDTWIGLQKITYSCLEALPASATLMFGPVMVSFLIAALKLRLIRL